MYRVGDKVRVKSLEGIRATLDPYRIKVDTEMLFAYEMEAWCGTIQKVERLIEDGRTGLNDRVRLSGIYMWAWHLDWIEPIKLDNREVREHG
jgi:hypothetical protein